MNNIILNMKVKDGIIGFIVGDALGVPVEFEERIELEENPVTGMRAYGSYSQPAGTWSDDSSMTLATMTSIVNANGIDYEDIMNEFAEWSNHSKYTNSESGTFDIGNATSKAINKYTAGTPALECGGLGERDYGNGSLMRILPLSYIPDIDYETIENVSGLTHAHKRVKIACILYIEIAKSMIANSELSVDEHIANANEKIKNHYKDSKALESFENIFNNHCPEEHLGRAHAIYTLESVLYCLKNTDNYSDAVLKAVNLGHDTDTTAAICGGLAGIYYGYDSIPIDWIKQINKIDEVLSLCERYEAFCDES
jgi:ADP-ribosylglycohydrolase